jgi:hypothetical protein
MRGPCLPANPVLADFLISAALCRRYGSADLVPLADDLEFAARAATMNRTVLTARRRGLTWTPRKHACPPGSVASPGQGARFGMSRRAGVRQ